MGALFNKTKFFKKEEDMLEWIDTHKVSTIEKTPLCVCSKEHSKFIFAVNTVARHSSTALKRFRDCIAEYNPSFAKKYLSSCDACCDLDNYVNKNFKIATADNLFYEKKWLLKNNKTKKSTRYHFQISFIDFNGERQPKWQLTLSVTGELASQFNAPVPQKQTPKKIKTKEEIKLEKAIAIINVFEVFLNKKGVPPNIFNKSAKKAFSENENPIYLLGEDYYEVEDAILDLL